MINIIDKKRRNLSFRFLSSIILFSFIFSLAIPYRPSYAQSLLLPPPGTRIPLTQPFSPAIIQGITVHPENPLEFDFIVNTGDSKLEGQAFRKEFNQLIKYFLASLTVPEEEVWVNLSPYEKDQMIPRMFGDTEMGRDLLAQDYMLKQLTASMMYPEEELGEEFWNKVYRKAQKKYGTANVPITTFVKVWIVPDQAVVYEQGANAVVLKSRLKVMLEEDYLALQRNLGLAKHGLDQITQAEAQTVSAISSEVVKEFLISEIEKEVNEGKTFANLRQIYNSIILATWFKDNLRQSLLGQVYVDRDKTKGVDTGDKKVNQKIYRQYLEAFKKGVFNYIKQDYDLVSRKTIRRRYFSGGTDFSKTGSLRQDVTIISAADLAALDGEHKSVKINLAEIPQGAEPSDVERAVQMPKANVSKEPTIEEIESQYRKPIIGGNLKREFKKGDIERLLLEIANELKVNNIDRDKVDVFLAPQELHLERFAAVLDILESEGAIPKGLIKLGAQNISRRDERGAFTGQHATTEQLKDYGVKYVIVGHSEARRGSEKDDSHLRYRESNAVVNAKVRSLIKAGLTPVLAFGESVEERAEGREFATVNSQVLESLSGVTTEQLLNSGLVLAYEPVWAIGKNALRSATKEEANSMHKFVRNIIRENFGAEAAAKVRIQYGGSVKSANAAELINELNIDGGLIGGAAKKGETFVPIIEKFTKMTPVSVLRTRRDQYPLLVTTQTAAELTVMGLRGAYQAVLDIINDSGKDIGQQLKDLTSIFEQLSQSTNKHEKLLPVIEMLSARKGPEPISKDELKKIKAAIKDVADGFAKRIFERTAKEQGLILMVRVSEGFGRDAVAESLKANEVIVPDEIASEAAKIQAAIDSGQEFYTSQQSGKAYPITDVIVDVVEGTNQFVTNSGGRSLKEVPDYEAGGTSVIVAGPGVRGLGNAPDGYVGQFITNLGSYASEFNKKKVLVSEDGKSAFYFLKDPELYARHPEQIVKYMEFLAKIRGQKLEELQEEIVIMDRDREAAFLNELSKLQVKIPGLKVVGQDQKGIADGTVPHGLKASMTKDIYEELTGRPYGLHKTVITIGGSAEGFMNLAMVGDLKSTGAVGGLRVYSGKMNKDTSGQTMKDQSQRYAFTDAEKKDIRELRAAYQDAEDILTGKKLFTEEDVKGKVSGVFSFISANGVFHQEGSREVSEGEVITKALKIETSDQQLKVEIVSQSNKVATDKTAVAQPVILPLIGKELGQIASQAATVQSQQAASPLGISVASSAVSAPERTGGINLNPALINLQIKRDPNGVPLPVFQQPLQNIKIRGFLPVIIRVTPVNIDEFLGFETVSRN